MLRAKPEALLLMSRVLGHMDPSFLVLKVPSWGFPWMFRRDGNWMWLYLQSSALQQPHF